MVRQPTDKPGPHGRVGRFFDGVGILVRRGLIDVDLVMDELRELILFSWDKMKPWVYEVRVEMKSPQTWENFEYLAEETRRRPSRSGEGTSRGRPR